MNAPPKEKGGGSNGTAAPNTTYVESSEHALGDNPDVNTPHALAFADGAPAAVTEFDWDSVEAGISSDSTPADAFEDSLLARFPDLARVMGQIFTVANASDPHPSVKQVASSFMALCFTARMQFIENQTLRDVALQLGVSHEAFSRRVHRWCRLTNRPPPGAKSASSCQKISDALRGRKRPRKPTA